jgi:diacylglycerol kinase (ATP)
MNEHDLDQQENALSLKGKTGVNRVFNAATYSIAGLRAAWAGEAAFRQIILLNIILLPLAFAVDVTRSERAILIFIPFLALIVELFNSAIEAVVDRISLDIHPLSKQAKDMGSAAQLLCLLLVAVTWSVILL